MSSLRASLRGRRNYQGESGVYLKDEWITCEWGWCGMPSQKECKNKAIYLIVFHESHPLVLPFHDVNFICEKHLKKLKELFKGEKLDYSIYEITECRVKVEFT
jgi:hypothetical protein